MGGGSSSAKKTNTNPTPAKDTSKESTTAEEQPDNTMNRNDPNKNKPTAAKDPAKPGSERKDQGSRDETRDGDGDDGSRDRRGRRDKKNERRNDRRQRSDSRDSRNDDNDSDDSRERRRRESPERGNSRDNRHKSRDQEESHTTHHDTDRKIYLQNLDKISKELFKKPPDPVNDSKTYTSAVDTYENKLHAAKNERELKSLFDRELKLLQNQTAEEHLRAKHAKHNEITRQTQESEYRLKLSALINCYKEKNRYYELLTLQREQEKREDMSFLMTLHEQIEKNDLSREDVLRQMDDYSRYFKGHRQENGHRSPTSSDKRHLSYQDRVNDSSNKYTTRPPPGQGFQPPPVSEPQYGSGGAGHPMPAGAKLRVKDEAERVMADSERNSQRAVDVRKADRSRINRELNSRASSFNSSSVPPK